jgi:hypothetical protein
MGVRYNPSIVTSGLVLALDAGNTKSYPGSGATLTDLSGNARNMTLTNSPTYATTNGGNILFDGSTQYGTASVPALTSYTLSFWLKIVDLSSGTEKYIFNSPNDQLGISVVSVSGWRWQSWNGSIGRQSTSTVTTGIWYNFIMTGTASTAEFFLNGSSINTFVSGATMASGTAHFNSTRSPITWHLNSNMGPISFYDRVLTAAEITQNFNALRGRFGV